MCHPASGLDCVVNVDDYADDYVMDVLLYVVLTMDVYAVGYVVNVDDQAVVVADHQSFVDFHINY